MTWRSLAKTPHIRVVPLFLLLGACASYAAVTVPINTPGTYAHQATANGVTVVADVYGTETKYKSVFDTAPSYDRGYLGVNMIFFNDSGETFAVDPTNITCTTRSGAVIEPIPATQVAEQVLRSTTGRYFAGGVLAAGSSKGANDRIRADFAAKELKARDLTPGTRSQGFLFFANTEQLQVLTVRGIRNTADGSLTTVEIAMPDIPIYDPGG